ncbi:hypothetical protein N7541_005428 [Penicillium brevicompactum]|uniref:Uncharacterized protein n=1 Tax=Penicillium brevicompactum TaxID=5074 RepID=A0A9W9QGA7_PENBR|nr:uncharacterized protein N7506_005285 [Penicillium brevicompactum]KAJ5335604.1 hypothetical protein N7452_008007 [Penicillium brevicompactum]KAJ5337263.1 hypothetical protein N7506_005285 [Penicillium brevicompactum]KAJ5358270.1 hypothetical protein N7541_005428 [Penicillium brevicompactum]
MPSSLASSERSGSVKSQHSPKTSLQSKADPNMALYEQEPTAVNLQPGSRDIFSLRSMQHKDREGRLITDPDQSNPTRSRLERPLDTIRSFDAAIDAHRKQQRM